MIAYDWVECLWGSRWRGDHGWCIQGFLLCWCERSNIRFWWWWHNSATILNTKEFYTLMSERVRHVSYTSIKEQSMTIFCSRDWAKSQMRLQVFVTKSHSQYDKIAIRCWKNASYANYERFNHSGKICLQVCTPVSSLFSLLI